MDLPFVKEDFEAGKDGSNFIGNVKFGFTSPDQFILNKDLDNYSITGKDMNQFFNGLRKMHKSNPDI